MRLGFIVTSPYQLFHYKRIHEFFSSVTAYLEVREQEFGVTEELVQKHLPGADMAWVSSKNLGEIDGQCDALVCQTPVPLMHFFSKSLVIAQQYSLAKERYQYGTWRAQANLNLMYGRYSTSCVSGFSNAVSVGNPLLDSRYAKGGPADCPAPSSSGLRVLYMPTYDDLTDRETAIHKLLAHDISLSIKFHHAEEGASAIAEDLSIPVVSPTDDPIEAILQHDVIVSDYSGAIFDALAVRRPVVLMSHLNEQSKNVHRLSKADRSRTQMKALVAEWDGGSDFVEVYERAREKLADEVVFSKFLDGYFVNLGSAGKACADEISNLVEHGEPENFAVRQVRETNRRYILENRELRAQLKVSSTSSNRSLDLASLKKSSWNALVLKSIRWVLLRIPGGDRLLDVLRRLRGTAEAHVDHHGTQAAAANPWSLSPVPHQRRAAMLKVLEEALVARGVDFRTRLTLSYAYCAVRDSTLDALRRAINDLGRQCRPGQLLVWLGQGTRYDTERFAEKLSLNDLVESDSLVLGIPYNNELYYAGRRAGVEILILQQRDVRLVARRWRAERVDWTSDFSSPATTGSTSAMRTENGAAKLHALESEPIDIVYTWVDSTDKEWQAARTLWAKRENIELDSSDNDERFANRDELRYSLRSVWLYAPFVRNIFIVTAGHAPDWLNVAHEKIHLISHKDIFPNDNLPTFNSHAIEACLSRIPGLAEHFLYFNDDVFLGRETKIETYYTKAGLIKSRFSPSSFVATVKPDLTAIPTDWASYNAFRLIERDFKMQFDRKMKHVPMPMKRCLLEEIAERYPDLVAQTRAARFRSRSDLSLPSMLAHYYGVATKRAVESENVPGEYVYADTGRSDFQSKLDLITKKEPLFFCLNVTRHTDIPFERQKTMLVSFLRQRYPVACDFELDTD